MKLFVFLRTVVVGAFIVFLLGGVAAETSFGQPDKPAAKLAAALAQNDQDQTLEEDVRRELHENTECEFVETPLSEVLQYFAKRHGIQIKFEHAAKVAGFDPDAPVTAKLKDVKLNEALARILKDLRLVHVVRRDVVLVTMRGRATPEEIKRRDEPVTTPKAKPPATAAKEIARKLDDEIVFKELSKLSECEFTETSLRNVCDFLGTRHEVRIELDKKAWDDDAPDPEIRVTSKLTRGSFGAMLDALLEPHELVFVVRDGAIVITKPKLAEVKELERIDKLRKTWKKPEVAAVDNAAVDNIEQQYLPQFRQVLKAELSFVNIVCRPTKEQRKLVERAGEKTLKSAVKAYADVQRKMQQGRARGNLEYPDPRSLILAGLTRSIQDNLTPEQAARYQAEGEKRQAHFKTTAVENLVARLDADLVLTAEQRGKLVESLTANWQAKWVQSLEMFMYDNQIFPTLPDSAIVPLLNETQKRVWQSHPKTQQMFFGGFGFGGFMGDDVIELDGVAEPADAVELEAAPHLDPDGKVR